MKRRKKKIETQEKIILTAKNKIITLEKIIIAPIMKLALRSSVNTIWGAIIIFSSVIILFFAVRIIFSCVSIFFFLRFNFFFPAFQFFFSLMFKFCFPLFLLPRILTHKPNFNSRGLRCLVLLVKKKIQKKNYFLYYILFF